MRVGSGRFGYGKGSGEYSGWRRKFLGVGTFLFEWQEKKTKSSRNVMFMFDTNKFVKRGKEKEGENYVKVGNGQRKRQRVGRKLPKYRKWTAERRE